MEASDKLQERIQTYHDRSFLKAAMAASALAAYADGKVSLVERYTIDDVLANLTTLKIHDPKKAVQILRDFVRELEKEPEAAEQVLRGKLERIADDKEAADIVARIALKVSHADGHFSYAEKLQFGRICETLKLQPEDIYPDWQAHWSPGQ